VKIRAAVLERTRGPLTVAELELAPPEAGEVLVRALQRRRIVEREAFAQERGEQHADVDARFVERAQHVVPAFGATAVQMGVDDHRDRTLRAVALDPAEAPGLADVRR